MKNHTARHLLATLALTTLLATSPPALAQTEDTAWTTKEGTTFWARLVGRNGKDLVLMARDRDFSVPVSRLSAQSVGMAARILNLTEEKLTETTTAPSEPESGKPLTYGEYYAPVSSKCGAARSVVTRRNSCPRSATRATCPQAVEEPVAAESQEEPANESTNESTNDSGSLDFGLEVVAFCKARLGMKVGNGQCATLAAEALAAAGAARMGKDSPKRGDYVWGEQVALLEYGRRGTAGVESLAKVKPGDIIQFRNVRLEGRGPSGGTYSMNADHHTAVVASVDPAGAALTCYHQNWGRMIVKQDRMQLTDLQSGWMRFYRPVAAE